MVLLVTVLTVLVCAFALICLKLIIRDRLSDAGRNDYQYGKLLQSNAYKHSLTKDIYGLEYFSSLLHKLEHRELDLYYHISLIKPGRSEQPFYHLSKKCNLHKLLHRKVSASLRPTFLKRYNDEYLIVAYASYECLDKSQVHSRQQKLLKLLPRELNVAGYKIALDYAITSMYTSSKSQLAELGKIERRLSYGMKLAQESVDGLYIHDEEQYCRAMQQKHITHELFHAIRYQQESFYTVYQPIYASQSDSEPSSYEALIRWNNKHNIGPAQFIPVLEEHEHLHYQFTFMVLERVVCDLIRLAQTDRHPNVSVNISTSDLCAPGFVQDIIALTERTPSLRGQLVFEITEHNQLIYSDKLKFAVTRLKGMGFNFSLDDFGSGYANLDALSLPFLTSVKIDKRYVDNIDSDEHKRTMLAKVIGLCTHDGRKVIVEGVELKEQADFLKSLRQPNIYIQGFFYSRPKPFSDAFSLLRPKQCVT